MQVEIGQSYKFKELTQVLLNEEPSKGNTRKRQIKEIETKISYLKNGHSYTVIEIYDEQKPKEDKRRDNGGKNLAMDYSSIDLTLARNLVNNCGKRGHISLSITRLAELTEMVKPDRQCFVSQDVRLKPFNNIELMRTLKHKYRHEDQINRYMSILNRSYHDYTITSLNRLQRAGYLTYTVVSKAALDSEDGYKHIYLTKEQVEIIKEVRDNIIETLDYTSKDVVLSPTKRKEVDEKLVDIINANDDRYLPSHMLSDKRGRGLFGFKFKYNCYEIVLKDSIYEYVKQLCEDCPYNVFSSKMSEKLEKLIKLNKIKSTFRKLVDLLLDNVIWKKFVDYTEKIVANRFKNKQQKRLQMERYERELLEQSLHQQTQEIVKSIIAEESSVEVVDGFTEIIVGQLLKQFYCRP